MTALAQPKDIRRLDPAYLALVRALPCCARHLGECSGPIEAHHRTGAGMALKADDHEAMPLCRKHHSELHRLAGAFKGWIKQQLRDWQALASAATRCAVAALDMFTPDASATAGEFVDEGVF